MKTEKNILGLSKCACCGYFTISEIKETCQVCFWDEEVFQVENPDDSAGPNHVSLNEARRNFLAYGCSDLRFKDMVRKPKDSELQ